MSFSSKEEFLSALRNTLQEFKTPFLNSLDETAESQDGDIQSTDQINKVLAEFDRLREILEREIQTIQRPSTQQGGGRTLDEQLVLRVFQQRGFLQSLQEHPEWIDDAIYTIRLFLQTYAFTPSIQHIQKLEKANVTSHVREIVPNQE